MDMQAWYMPMLTCMQRNVAILMQLESTCGMMLHEDACHMQFAANCMEHAWLMC